MVKNFITWRNVSNVLGLLSFLLTSAIATGAITAPTAILHAGLVIAGITFVINDEFREAYLNSLGDKDSEVR